MYQKGTPLGNLIHQKSPYSARKTRYEKKVQKHCPKPVAKTIYTYAVLLLSCCGLQARAAERTDSRADHPPGGRLSPTGLRRNRSNSAPSRSDDCWNHFRLEACLTTYAQISSIRDNPANQTPTCCSAMLQVWAGE